MSHSLPDAPTTGGVSRRSMLKGTAGALALTGGLPALLAACGGGSSGPTKGSVDGKTSIGSNYSDANVKKAFANVVAGYSRHANVSINTTDHNSFQNNIQNYLQGTPNDVFCWFSGYRTQFFAQQGLLQPIDDVWATIGGHFTDAVKKASKGQDGKYYLVPWVTYPWAMFYKKSVFAKHGYQVPGTWDELIALCKKMKSDGMANPISIGQKDGWPAMGTFDIINMRVNGYQFHVDLMAHKESWTDPKVKNVFKQWSELTQYYTPGATGRTWEEAVQLFDQGKDSGMIFHGLDQVVPQVSDVSDLDYFPFPEIDPTYPTDSAIDAPIDGFLMSKKVKNLEAATAFMEYLGTAQAQAAFLKGNPADIGTATDYDTSTYTTLQKKAVQTISGTKNLAQFLDRDSRPDFAYPIVQNALNQFLNSPNSYSSVCSSLESQAKGIFTS